MTPADTANCKSAFDGLEDSRHRARLLDDAFPKCACEACSVGQGSPGKVEDCEDIYRFFVSPGDIDERSNQIFTTAFEKAAQNGLSVFRGCATDQDIKNLVQDRLTVKPGRPFLTVLGLLKVSVRDIRVIEGGVGARVFCVYDETVPHSLSHVPTHVSIYQRVPAPKAEGRNKIIQSDNFKLHSLLVQQRIDIKGFRAGLLEDLNRRSMAGEFVIAEKAAD